MNTYLISHKRGAASYDEAFVDAVGLRDSDKTPTQADISPQIGLDSQLDTLLRWRRVRGKSF
jgi:hypothetical protein